jgi:hypothetical protein
LKDEYVNYRSEVDCDAISPKHLQTLTLCVSVHVPKHSLSVYGRLLVDMVEIDKHDPDCKHPTSYRHTPSESLSVFFDTQSLNGCLSVDALRI